MLKILLIEPDALLAKNYQAALTKSGHQVIWSQSAGHAIHLFDKHNPNVVVLELQLANNNGVEFLYEFRSYPEWADIPVIIHSLVPKHSLNIPETAWQTLGVVGYLYKPATRLEDLVSEVNRNMATAK